MMRPSGMLTRFMANTDYQVPRKHTKKKESVNAAHPDLHLLHGGPTGSLDVIKSGVVDAITVTIHVNPATSADTRTNIRTNPNHMCVLLSRRRTSRYTEVES